MPIGGVPVLFPFKPYPSQRAMMAKVGRSYQHTASHDISLTTPGNPIPQPGSQCSAGESDREWEESGAALLLSGLGHPEEK